MAKPFPFRTLAIAVALDGSKLSREQRCRPRNRGAATLLASKKRNGPTRCLRHRPGLDLNLPRKAKTMQNSTTIRTGALALGLFFAGITGRTIFDDVWTGAPVTVAHLNAMGALVAAVAGAHFIVPAIKGRRFLIAFGLALVFGAATAYVVISSGARNAELSATKAAAVTKANEARQAAKSKLDEAEADLSGLRLELRAAVVAAALECKSGKGTKCDGTAGTRDAAARDVERAEIAASRHRQVLEALPPIAEPNGGYAQAARVLEALGLADALDIERRLALLMPFALVLITELSTVVFLAMGLGHRSPGGIAKRDQAAKTGETISNLSQSVITGRNHVEIEPENEPPTPGKRGPALLPENVVALHPGKHPVLAALEGAGGAVASNAELAGLLGVSPGQASKLRRAVEHLLIEEREGKACRIAIRKAAS